MGLGGGQPDSRFRYVLGRVVTKFNNNGNDSDSSSVVSVRVTTTPCRERDEYRQPEHKQQ